MHGKNVLATRASKEQFSAVKKTVRGAKFEHSARAIVLRRDNKIFYGKGLITVISAGTSDIPVAEEAVVTAEIMGNEVERLYDVGVAEVFTGLLAHRKAISRSASDYRLRWHGGRITQRCRRIGRSAGDRGPHQRGLWRSLPRNGSPAWHDEFLRFQCIRGQHRQWIWRGLCCFVNKSTVVGQHAANIHRRPILGLDF